MPKLSPFALTEFHQVFPESVRWRITPSGVEIENSGLIPVPDAARKRCLDYLARFAEHFAWVSREYQVPVELLIACALTESVSSDPTGCLRKEPGYRSDAETPHRISVGLCQLLISTARAAMGNPSIDRTWLQDARNNLRACAAYIRRQSKITRFDPILVACAYNAGSVYENRGAANRWRLRQFPIGTSKHADRFAMFFNAAMQLEPAALPPEASRYRELLG
jgi:hypothetical protein